MVNAAPSGRSYRAEWPFNVWLDHVAAWRIRGAMVFARGKLKPACKMLGVNYHSARRILQRDNARMEKQAKELTPWID
jgi:hypothetical protein